MDAGERLTIESHTRPPIGAIGWLLIAALAVAIGFSTKSGGWFVAAVLPAGLAVALWWARPPLMRAWLDDERLSIEAPEYEIPLDSIQSVTMGGRAQALGEPLSTGNLMIMFREGMVEFPDNLNVSMPELYTKLIEHCRRNPPSERESALSDEAAAQVQEFGAERVRLFHARNVRGGRPADRARAIAMALIVVSIVWFTSAAIPNFHAGTNFALSAIWLLIIGVLMLIGAVRYRNLYPSQQIPNWHRSALLVSPVGIWLVQGELRGRLQWDEIQDVRIGRSRRPGGNPLPGSIAVRVPGTRIVIWDIYDRPLAVIYDVIRSFWRPT